MNLVHEPPPSETNKPIIAPVLRIENVLSIKNMLSIKNVKSGGLRAA